MQLNSRRNRHHIPRISFLSGAHHAILKKTKIPGVWNLRLTLVWVGNMRPNMARVYCLGTGGAGRYAQLNEIHPTVRGVGAAPNLFSSERTMRCGNDAFS
jgi:hypothetical protein